ncbi:sushi, von Willebrand factor type A, EGF and pentraxin domain-containing protein 1-like, partial [Saccostrea cucullata]|uniref:sushi, von Willebrand factor type A, EGF and pentraxin domain-containing protein 1-like n=1 Tax=Saccostrea cuccullata TaxID=36930 RepID=UPI002ED3AE69
LDDCGSNRNGCLYNSTCKDGVDSYVCECASGLSGRHCQVTRDFCSGSPCPNGGCVNDYTTLSPKCFCDYPYQLGNNGQCEKMDLCNNTDCNNGTCNSLTGKCTCDTGFEGSSCQHSVDDCKGMPCKNGSTCIDGHQDYSCKCMLGFTGKNCDMDQADCPGSCNMTTTQKTVDKINECECLCKPGYTGQNCTEEVDECGSFPCKHGATCTDTVNDYHCNCTEGWEGKNCDQQINFCMITFHKCQSGDCYNLIDDRYCRCNAGTRGEACEDIPDVCNVISPCTSRGICQNANGTAICSCQNNYSGDSCQLLKDLCRGKTNCLYQGMPNTGGTCTNLPAGGFNCACQTGYTGGTCQTKVTRCSTLNCGSVAMCNEEISCYCPEGKILTENKVCKTPSNDFDMLFDNLIGEEGASTTAVLSSDLEKESSLSFMLWVRFHKDQKETADAVLFKLGGIIQVKNNTIIFTNATNIHTVNTVAFGYPIRLDDGAWHFIVVSWKQNGETLVHVDNILISNDNSVSGSLPNMLDVEVGKKFGGRLSQVKIWSNSLNRNDMFQLFNNKDFQPPAGSTVVHGWYNYKMSKGVLKKFPSRIKDDQVCDIPACSKSDKLKPKRKSCAADVFVYSSNGFIFYQLPSFISMFDDFNESLSSLSSYPKDNIYTWGAYNLFFLATDENGNTAMCHSKLYVKYNPDCPSPRTYSPTSIKYCSSSKDICKFECPGNQQQSPPAPRYKMCSELGVYNPLNPRQKFLVPSCANASKVNIKVEVSLRYLFVVTCSPVFETSMRSSILTTFKNIVFNNWNGVCTTSDCNNMEILCICVPESKQMIVTLQINNLRHTITKKENGSDTYTPKEVFLYLIAEETVFQAEHIGGATMLNDHLVVRDSLWCPEDYMVVGDNCVECSIGTFFNSTSHNCEYCPIGTYGDQYGLKACKSCEIGKTTLGLGNTDSTDCVDDCQVGQFWNVTKCAFCKKHSYQDMTGQDYCLPCPPGKKTSAIGSNSSSQCFDDCGEGTELKPDGKCMECPRGYYRSFAEDVCTMYSWNDYYWEWGS